MVNLRQAQDQLALAHFEPDSLRPDEVTMRRLEAVMAEAEEARRTFETQRAETMRSLMEMERTLMANLDRIGGEMAQVEAKRQEVESQRGECEAEQNRLLEERRNEEQRIRRITEDLKNQEQRLAQRRQEDADELAACETQLSARKESLARAAEVVLERRAGAGCGLDGHQIAASVRLRVPSSRAYRNTPTRMNSIRVNDSAAAVG